MFHRVERKFLELIALICSLAIYTFAFVLLYPHIGRLGGMVALVPITIGAYFCGIPGSIIVSLLIFPLTSVALAHVEGATPLLGKSRILAFGITVIYGSAIGLVLHLVRKVRKNEELLRLTLEATSDGLWDYDVDRDHLMLSERWLTMLGYERHEVSATLEGWRSLVHPDDQHLWTLSRARLQAGETVEIRTEYRMRAKNGAYRLLLCRGRAVSTDASGAVRRIVGAHTDITEQRRAQQDVTRLAYHNQVTGLHNRRSYFERVEGTAPETGENRGLIVLDIEGFKQINESLGHEAGDTVLRDVASRGVANVSDSESLFHLGGDEFALYVPFLRDEDQLRLTARNLLTVLNRPYHFNTETLHLRFVAGLASCNAEVTSAHSLLQFATTALSRAKRQGVTLQVYSEGMEESSRTHLHMVQDLRKAVSDREFSVHYQPIHVDGEIVGFEALARWEHPSNGNISPAVFIPIAEESGLISEIGQQVLETACRDLSRIRRTTAKDLYVSVNLSVKQLGDFNLVAVIEELLLRYELPPSALRLEVTESSLMVNLEQLLPVLEAIRRLGVVLSVDDFGTGYSSLAYLKRLPISVVKIDRSFIIGIPSDRRDVAIVRSIIAMAEGLGMELVAEGVDRIEQLDCLSQLGCRGVQGFLYSRPKPVDELEADVRVRPVYNPETISRN